MTKILRKLNPEKALIWRIVHRSNLPWIIKNGLHCGNSNSRSKQWVNIGNTEIISGRQSKEVTKKPFGTLDDYIPFYFTPKSPMMLNILTGRDVEQFPKEEIVILVGELRVLKKEYQCVFTDRHGLTELVQFYRNLKDLDKIDWGFYKRRIFVETQTIQVRWSAIKPRPLFINTYQ